MRIETITPAFQDDRGTIMDLVEGQNHAVTLVQSHPGAIRGNHFHQETEQWAYVLSGRLLVSNAWEEIEVKAGQLVYNPPGEPHAWQALEPTVCVVFAKGPRAGRNYESDTQRLEVPLIQ